MLQLVAAVLLIGLLAMGIIGLCMKSHVGQQCDWCDGFACPRIKWGECRLSSELTTNIAPVGSPVPGLSPAITPSRLAPASPISTNDTVTVDYG